MVGVRVRSVGIHGMGDSVRLGGRWVFEKLVLGVLGAVFRYELGKHCSELGQVSSKSAVVAMHTGIMDP